MVNIGAIANLKNRNQPRLTKKAESQIAQLRVAPQPYYYGRVGWTWDGGTEVYSTSNQTNTSTTRKVQIYLWANGADHVLYTIQAGPGGLESRWSPRPILSFSPDKSYVAISDFGFTIYGSNVRIFSLADLRQKFVTAASSSGGTWLANDRFAWAEMSGALKQWTPTAGASLLRTGGVVRRNGGFRLEVDSGDAHRRQHFHAARIHRSPGAWQNIPYPPGQQPRICDARSGLVCRGKDRYQWWFHLLAAVLLPECARWCHPRPRRRESNRQDRQLPLGADAERHLRQRRVLLY